MSQLDQYKINGKTVYSLKSRFLTIRKVKYEIISGTSTGKLANEVHYELRNLQTGEVINRSMDKIVAELLKDENKAL